MSWPPVGSVVAVCEYGCRLQACLPWQAWNVGAQDLGQQKHQRWLFRENGQGCHDIADDVAHLSTWQTYVTCHTSRELALKAKRSKPLRCIYAKTIKARFLKISNSLCTLGGSYCEKKASWTKSVELIVSTLRKHEVKCGAVSTGDLLKFSVRPAREEFSREKRTLRVWLHFGVCIWRRSNSVCTWSTYSYEEDLSNRQSWTLWRQKQQKSCLESGLVAAKKDLTQRGNP